MKAATMYKSILLTVSIGLCVTSQAKENVNDGPLHRSGNENSVLTNCQPGKTQTELKHVSWPTRNQAIVFTVVVILVSIIVSLFLGFFDFLFKTALQTILGQ